MSLSTEVREFAFGISPDDARRLAGEIEVGWTRDSSGIVRGTFHGTNILLYDKLLTNVMYPPVDDISGPIAILFHTSPKRTAEDLRNIAMFRVSYYNKILTERQVGDDN